MIRTASNRALSLRLTAEDGPCGVSLSLSAVSCFCSISFSLCAVSRWVLLLLPLLLPLRPP